MVANGKLGESEHILSEVRRMAPAATSLGEESPSGLVRCKACGRLCTSWAGLSIHYSKRHIRSRTSATRKPIQAPRPLTLWDLRYGGKKWQ